MDFLKKIWTFVLEKTGLSKKESKKTEPEMELFSPVGPTGDLPTAETVETVETDVDKKTEMSSFTHYIDYLLENSKNYPDLTSKLLELKSTIDETTVEIGKAISESIFNDLEERMSKDKESAKTEYIADGRTIITDAELIKDLSPTPLKVETVKDIKSKSRKPKPNKSHNSDVKKDVKKPETKKPEQPKKTAPKKQDVKKPADRPKQEPKPKKKPDEGK